MYDMAGKEARANHIFSLSLSLSLFVFLDGMDYAK
jgi:hypothetical protein